MTDTARLKRFVQDVNASINESDRAGGLPRGLTDHLSKLVHDDDWLPDDFALPDPASYRQYLLYCDPAERFTVVSFVWSAGQSTPIHDHTVWGAIGQLRGSEVSIPYVRGASGILTALPPQSSAPGDVISFLPERGDIHKVENPGPDVAISIHVYGGNIGTIERSTYDPDTGESAPFISGYSTDVLPNIWLK